MSDVNANIGIDFDITQGLQQLRQLQAGLSRFNQSLTQGNVTAAAAQKSLNAQLMQAINATGKFVATQKTVAASTTAFTDALEKNKFSLKEYFRYTAAAATANTKVLTNMFAKEREIINRARKDRVKSLQSQYIQLTNAQGELVKVLQVVPKHLEMVNGKYADYATRVQMAAQRQQLLNQLIKQGSTQLLNFGKNTQWAGRQLMVGLTIPLTMLGSFAAQTFKDMEMAVIRFARVYGDAFTSGDATNKAIEEIKKLGMEFTKYGVAVKDTITMAADAAAMGLTGSALTAQVSAATKLSVLGQVEQQQALETTISLQNAFGISSEQLAQKINFLNAVENQTALSIADLTEAIPKAGPVVKQLGGSVEDLAFFMTAMKEGGINASEGANALKSGLASMINPGKKTVEMLAGLGINIKGIVDSNAGNLKATVVGVAQALDTLDPLNRARAIEQLFGKFQFSRLSTLFQNIVKDGSQASRTLGLASASVEELAILSERELGKVENAVSVKFQKSIEQLKMQLAPVGETFLKAITPVVQFFGKLLEKFNNLGEGTKKTITVITAVLAGIAPVALMTFGLLANGAANIIKLFGLLRGGMAKLNGQNNVLGGGFDYLTQAELENLAQSNALHTSHQQLIETFNVEAGALNALAAAYGATATQARNLAAANPGIFNSVPGAKGATSKLPGYADGILSVPGPKGAGDVVPAMLSPGETVVPAKQSEKHRGFLSAIISDSIPGFIDGKDAWASQAVSRLNVSGRTDVGGLAEELAKDLAKVLNRAAKQGVDESQVEQRYKEAVDGAIDELGQLAEYTKETFKKMRDEALRPMFEETGVQTARYQQEKGQFAHVGQPVSVPLDQVSSTVNITNPKILQELDTTVKALKAAGQEMPTARVMSMSAYNLPGYLNRVMAEKNKSGQANFEKENGTTVIDSFMKAFEDEGPKKWKRTTDALGIAFDDVAAEMKDYDDDLLERVRTWKAKNPNGFFNDEVFSSIEAEARANATQGVRQILDAADNIISAIRVPLNDAQAQIVQDYAASQGLTVPKVVKGATGNRKISNAEARKASGGMGTFDAPGSMNTPQSIAQQVQEDLTKAESVAETNSPSKRTRRLGKNMGEGLAQGLDESQVKVKEASKRLVDTASGKTYTSQEIKDRIGFKSNVNSSIPEGTQVINSFTPSFYPNGKMVTDGDGNPLPPKAAKKLVSQYKRGLRREKVGAYSGKAAGALGTAAMVSGMMGAPGAVTGALGTASMVAGFAPAIAGMGPIGITVAAIGAVGLGLKMLDKHFRDAAVKQAEYVRSISATTEKMQAIGELTGKVGASQLMARRREGGQYQSYNEAQRKGSDFGQKFLTEATGKAMQDAFSSNAVKVGSKRAAETLALELSQYISDGVMTAEDAKSVAYQIGVNLGDSTITTNIQGQLRMLVGPNGEDLLKDPLRARMRIVSIAENRSARALSEMGQANAQGYSGATEAAQYASYAQNSIQVAQAQADAIAVYAEKQKKSLDAELAITTNKERQVQIQTELNRLVDIQAIANARVATSIATAVAGFEKVYGGGASAGSVARREDAFFDASKADVRAKYAGTQYAEAAQRVLNLGARADQDRTLGLKGGRTFEAKVNFIMASGVMNPQQVESLMKMFKGDLAKMDMVLNVGIRKQGAARIADLTSLLSGVDGDISKRIMVSMIRKNPQDFDKASKALALLQASDGYEVNMSAYLKVVGQKGLDLLANKLDAIEKIKDPITKVLDLQNTGMTSKELEVLTANWDYYMSLDPVTRKEAIQTYTMISDAIINFDSPEARAEWARRYAEQEALMAGDKGSKKYKEQYDIVYNIAVKGDAGQVANRLTQAKYGDPSFINPIKPNSNANPSDSTATNPLAFLDDLAQRLKNVRDGSFDATKALSSILAAFTNPKVKKDASAMFSIFDGLQNRLLRFGAAKEFRDAIASMSNEDFAKIAALKGNKALFTFQNGKPKTKANITGLTTTGKAVSAGYQEAALGDYNLVQEETVKNVQAQSKAFNMLIASGMSTTAALRTVEDASVAAAIAAGRVGKTGSKEMQMFIEKTNAANNALERQAVLNDIIAKNNEFEIVKQMPELATTMKSLGYSIEQIGTVMSDPALAKQMINDLKDGKLDAKDIADYLNSIEARKVIDIQVKLNSGDYVGVAKDAMSAVDEMFAVQEELIRTGLDPRSTAIVSELNKNNDTIDKLQDSLKGLQRDADKLSTEISDGQRDIEINYTRPIEDLNKKISGLDRELETSPLFGNRVIQGLQEQSSVLSHDLDVISHAAEKVNEEYDKQAEALNKVAEANAQIVEQQKQQLDLADAITSGDIAAAARAVQQMRATQAQRYTDNAQTALDQARQNALNSLKGPSGLTETEIKEKQYQLSQQIYNIENDPRRIETQKKIVELQDEIYNKELARQKALDLIRIKEDELYKLQRDKIKPIQDEINLLSNRNDQLNKQLDTLVKNLTVLGQTREEWLLVKAKIAAADLASKDLEKTFGALLEAARAIDAMWASILAKLAQYNVGGGGGGGGGGGNGWVDPSLNPELTTFTTEQQDIINNAQDDAAAAFEIGDDKKAEQIAVDAMKALANIQSVDGNTKIADTQLGSAQVVSARKQILGYLNSGGLVPQYFANGGYARGFDTVPAMLTPGEFIMSKYAVQSYGVDTLRAMNSGKPFGDSVYNYDISVNVKSEANPNEIAQVVMTQIKNIDSQRIRGNRL